MILGLMLLIIVTMVLILCVVVNKLIINCDLVVLWRHIVGSIDNRTIGKGMTSSQLFRKPGPRSDRGLQFPSDRGPIAVRPREWRRSDRYWSAVRSRLCLRNRK